jgi:creatinine amidohydrolase
VRGVLETRQLALDRKAAGPYSVTLLEEARRPPPEEIAALRPWKLQELTYGMVRERQFEVAVLPIGATEPHNLHIPYGSDAFHGELIADRCCEAAHGMGAKVVLLPTIPYGSDSNQLAFPLAIHVGQPVLDAIVTEIVRSLERHGILKFVLFNSHGGNEFKPLLRELYGRTKVFVALVDWWKVAADHAKAVFEKTGDHADEMETSVGLALFGDLIHLQDADDGAIRESRFEAINRGWVQITRPWHLLTKNSGVGDPRAATADKGERYIQLTVERVARFLKELSDATMDETFPY